MRGKQAWIIRQRTRLSRGILGDKPFTGSHWITFAGGKDPNPDRGGVLGMRETADWIRSCEGSVDLAIEDPDAGHGGFHQNPKNTNLALDIFEKLRTEDALKSNSE